MDIKLWDNHFGTPTELLRHLMREATSEPSLDVPSETNNADKLDSVIESLLVGPPIDERAIMQRFAELEVSEWHPPEVEYLDAQTLNYWDEAGVNLDRVIEACLNLASDANAEEGDGP